MSVEATIRKKVKTAFQTEILSIQNESHLHSGPATDSHFNLTIVSEYFSKLTRVKRHQAVYALLSEELANGVYALALHLFTPDEWLSKEANMPDSPSCLGGSKVDMRG
tara:strand:+ start:134 stop:457 length:324 start_codon:yes stop_codon:yes gene_type:complete